MSLTDRPMGVPAAERSVHADTRTAPDGRRADRGGTAAGDLVVGISGAIQNAAVAVAVDGRLVACCEQERVTRVRSEGLRPGAVPAAALTSLLDTIQRSPGAISAYVTAEAGVTLPPGLPHATVGHHFAHAATACLTSPFSSAAVLVCDEQGDPPVSVWTFSDGQLVNAHWPWKGPSLAAIYSQCARLLGLGPRSEHKLEALARVGTAGTLADLGRQLTYENGGFDVDPRWAETVTAAVSAGASPSAAANAASSFQQCIGDAVVALAREIRERFGSEHLCLGGGLFYNTYLNTRLAESKLFRDVFVPLNPGNAGLAVGAALAWARRDSLDATPVSPFLGPQYTTDEIKATLDNCKLVYDYQSQAEVVATVVKELTRGALVGWFQGRMEWGHRSLGHRSILASPFAPHVLENLNGYLKQREPYRTYGLSVLEEDAAQHFQVSAPSRFMELEYAPIEPHAFRHMLPHGARRLRVQTVTSEAGLFRDVLRAFGAASGRGVLVNTSFNSVHEPIVCSPRDAVRVFYGSGLDVLIIGQFVIRK